MALETKTDPAPMVVGKPEYDVKDINLADRGKAASSGPTRRCRCSAPSASGSRRRSRSPGSACRPASTSPPRRRTWPALKAGGADVVLCASNPLSTQDDVAAGLVNDYGIPRYAIKGEDNDDLLPAHQRRPRPPAAHHHGRRRRPGLHHPQRPHRPARQRRRQHGGDHHRRHPPRAMEKDGVLKFPVIAVNDAHDQALFDNRYGTGQSTIDGIIRATDHPARRPEVRGRRLRLVRQGRGVPSARAWAPT